MQRLQRDDELRGRAIRIGDDVLLGKARDRVGIDLGHDQRHVGVGAPGGGIIDDDAALPADLRRHIPSRSRRRPTSGRCRCRRNRSSPALCISASCRRTRPRCRASACEASATTSSAGNWRSARISSISRPTLPVAPTTATLKPILISSARQSRTAVDNATAEPRQSALAAQLRARLKTKCYQVLRRHKALVDAISQIASVAVTGRQEVPVQSPCERQ